MNEVGLLQVLETLLGVRVAQAVPERRLLRRSLVLLVLLELIDVGHRKSRTEFCNIFSVLHYIIQILNL